LNEHGLTSAPIQYRLYGRRFLQVWWPNQRCQSTEGGWLVHGVNVNHLVVKLHHRQPFSSFSCWLTSAQVTFCQVSNC